MAQLNDSELPFSLLQFYATSPYACSYLPDEQARSQVATPTHLINAEIYSQLVRAGFRRSGVFAYRPHCDRCHACIPVRIPVDEFRPNRAQRRVARLHGGPSPVAARELPLTFDPRHFDLYQRYQAARHAGGGMDQDSRDQYAHFLLQSRVESKLIEFTLKGQLVMISILDVLSDGLSSVYTFYDPTTRPASLGTYNILWQIAECKLLGLPFLYLGYWIRNSKKMAYKANFRPIEGYIDGQWVRLARTEFDR